MEDLLAKRMEPTSRANLMWLAMSELIRTIEHLRDGKTPPNTAEIEVVPHNAIDSKLLKELAKLDWSKT